MYWGLILASTDRQSSLDAEDAPIPPLEVWCRYQNHCAAYIIDTIVYGVKYSGLPWCFHPPKYIFISAQHFSCLPLVWPLPARDKRAVPRTLNETIVWKTARVYQSPATLIWGARCGSCVVSSVLAGSLIQLQICWPCVQYSQPSKILGVPQVSSSVCSAVVFNLPSSNSNTQGLGTICLGITHIHNVSHGLCPKRQESECYWLLWEKHVQCESYTLAQVSIFKHH